MRTRTFMGRVLGAGLFLVRVVLSYGLVMAQVGLHWPDAATYTAEAAGPDAPAQLQWLRAELDAGGATRMQSLFPEGFVFTWALYGLAEVQVGLRFPPEDPRRAAAAAGARRALRALESAEGLRPFRGLEDPPTGTFYLGWSNWLRGGLLLLDPPDVRDPEDVRRFRVGCGLIARAFQQHGPYPPSYAGQAWPADGVVAAASLRLHDTLFDPLYGGTLARWLAAASQRVDAQGLLPHSARAFSEPGLPARGSSQALMLRFLYEIDPERTRDWYREFRKRFVVTVWGLPAVREHRIGVVGEGDVDSGPLIAGASAPAMVVNVGTAIQLGDRAYAEPMINTLEMVGMPLGLEGKRYAFGQLPVGDAFLVWSKTARPFTRPVREETWSPVVSAWWRWPWHLGFSLLVVGLWWAPIRRWLR